MWFFKLLFGDKDDEWRRIDEERRRLRERERELWDFEDRLYAKERELRRLARELEGRERELDEREEKLREKEKKLENREKAFDKSYEALKEGYKRLEEKREKVKKKIREIKQKEAELKRKEEELEEREREIEERIKEGGFVKMVPVQILIRGQDQEKFYTAINFEVPIQYAGLIRSEIRRDLSGTEYKFTDDGFYWKFRLRAYSGKQEKSNPQWFHVLRWLEDNRVILNNDQYTVVSTTSGIAGWDPKEEPIGDKEYKITHICESLTTSGFAEVEVMVGESAQTKEEDEIPF